MEIIDVFNQSAFNAVSMTTAINIIPHQPRRIGQMKLFVPAGIPTTTASIDFKNGVLTLLSTKARGEAANQMPRGGRNARSFPVPHIPVDDVVQPDDIQNIRAFGSGSVLEAVASVVNERLTSMRDSLEATIEHLRVGALKGAILDYDGTTVLFDVFTEFGVTQKVVDFILGTGTTKVKTKCLEVKRHVESVLGSATYDHVHCFCSESFFDKLISHDEVKAAYDRHQSGSFLRDDNRNGFKYAGIVFEEYRGKVGNVDFIADGDARFFPVGVQSLYKQWNAPGNFMQAANTIGKPLYARQIVRPDGSGVDLKTEANPLPMCTRPGVLVRGHTSN